MLLELPAELRTGIQAVDEQHEALIALHNDIVTGFDANRPPYYAIEALARLYQYSRQHFDSEEKIMERYGYEDLENHREAHRALLEQLRRVVLQYRQNPGSVTQSIKGFVNDWVVAHIEESDMQFAQPIRQAMERERAEILGEELSNVE